ncbi:EAL domain-containing protein [Idiomarina xiamenensis]|uniref:Signal protein n=1 Tax=Idiomarina xiamenensis 10-D-4 TaxID=740709 RepID=K2KEX0_9GAMM|nr:EAL domain-containing protein [Idiomarina xiamenensis]EKE85267.1 signal protein [Idiomarina xiamenensis 10-D-4]
MPGCGPCTCQQRLPFDIKMAMQAIVDLNAGQIFAHEALVRGSQGEGAGFVLSQVDDDNRYSFDQRCRVKAIETAAQLQLPARLSINFMPNAIYEPETCLATTLKAAGRYQFPHQRIIFEVTEQESVVDRAFLIDVFQAYREHGFMTAIDDFGAGYAGLGLLADFQPDIIKIDMKLLRDIHLHNAKQAIVRGICQIANELGIAIIAEGIESQEELQFVRELGVYLVQGYLFHKPQLGRLDAPAGLS